MSHHPHRAPKTAFVILIGGPGKFAPCDREHDKTWTDYIVPVQVACSKNQLQLAPGESLQWWVYAPAYRERWSDDLSVVSGPKADPGRNLIDSRQKAIDKVTSSGAADYLDRIKNIAGTVLASFRAIETPEEFWKGLKELPDHSLSRLWYIGHASDKGLMLKLQHDPVKCQPQANLADMVLVEDIAKNSSVISKKLASTGKPSKFYGCYTKSFAEQWNNVFGAAAEGAVMKIDFGVTDSKSDIEQVMPRLEQSKTDTGWTSFPAR